MPSSLTSGSISPGSSRVPTPTANDFPTPQGQIFTVTKRDRGLVSPVESSFSFRDEDSPIHALSASDLIDDRTMARPLVRGTPGDSALALDADDDIQQTDVRRKKSQYYTEVFAYREPNLSPRERICKDSVITAEVKTNVIIRDEFDFLQDFSQHLSQRYQRPTSSIFITLDHSACLLYAGSFDSAYILTISALPSQLLPTTNKRNAALIQVFLADALGVAASRGVVRFAGTPEENLGYNGTTVSGQIESLQNVSSQSRRPSRAPSRVQSRNQSRRQSMARLVEAPTYQIYPTTPRTSPSLKSPPIPPLPAEKTVLDKRAEKTQRMGKRRSFMAIFKR